MWKIRLSNVKWFAQGGCQLRQSRPKTKSVSFQSFLQPTFPHYLSQLVFWWLVKGERIKWFRKLIKIQLQITRTLVPKTSRLDCVPLHWGGITPDHICILHARTGAVTCKKYHQKAPFLQLNFLLLRGFSPSSFSTTVENVVSWGKIRKCNPFSRLFLTSYQKLSKQI